MVMKEGFVLFLSIALGYVLCVMADKQKGLLKTVGYTFGISIMVLTLLYGAVASEAQCYAAKKMAKHGGACGMMAKHHRMVKR